MIGPSATLLEHWAIFDGQYFHVWKHRITLVFKQKKVWQIIVRTEAKLITYSKGCCGLFREAFFIHSSCHPSMISCMLLSHESQAVQTSRFSVTRVHEYLWNVVYREVLEM